MKVMCAWQQQNSVADREIILAHAARRGQIRAHVLIVNHHAIERVELVGRGRGSSEATG